MEGEINDWEVLQGSSDDNSSRSFEGIEDGSSRGMIRSDHFSLDRVVDDDTDASVESDNPSWIDPSSCETPYGRKKHPSELWSDDSSSDPSDDRKFRDFDVRNDLGLRDFSEIQLQNEESSNLFGDGVQREKVESKEEETEKVAEENSTVKKSRREMVWWKVPLELLKHCLFKVSPVWSFSVAAAVVGFVILGRRLYKMKKKTLNLPLKVTVDDKKVSQLMSRAARLNEAFTVVRRVPIIRPALPAPGLNQWPVMSLR